jgi:hypothetical protein
MKSVGKKLVAMLTFALATQTIHLVEPIKASEVENQQSAKKTN